LIRLRYNVNDSKFWTFNDKNAKNILLPVKPDFFRYFTLDDLKDNIIIEVKETKEIVVKLKIPVKGNNKTGYLTYERTYLEVDHDAAEDNNGIIIQSTLGFGVFPFFKVSEKKYNDFFNILQYFHPKEDLNCTFIRQINHSPDFEVAQKTLETERTRKAKGQNLITRYTELSSFSRNPQGFLEIDNEKTILLRLSLLNGLLMKILLDSH